MRVSNLVIGSTALALLSTLAFCHGDCGGKGAVTPPAFTGRFVADPNAPQAWLFAWSNSTISARFFGTRIAVRLADVNDAGGPGDGPNHYNVTIDDRPSFVLAMKPHETTYTLADDLPAGEHNVTLVKRTEALVGTARFSGFDVGSDGRMLPPPPLPERRLLIIGDSISAGYGNEGRDQNCRFTPDTENAAAAYGPLAAKALHAQAQVVAWSGKGVYRNRDSSRDNVIPQLLERVLPNETTSRWDPNAFVPQAVVINLGTNDFGHDVAPEEPFEEAYYDLVMRLHGMYPDAYIVMALGPMLLDTPDNHNQLTEARRMLHNVSERLHKAQVLRVGFLEFPTQRGELGYGCDWHPSLATQAKMAEQLAASLAATLNWQ